ncbi:substrate-binding domain-containing protein (plasmid) [Rhizobium sp. RCAM05350]|nr:substrate-binding domain-containing protein [Rhizobium sp. RCAM05350]
MKSIAAGSALVGIQSFVGVSRAANPLKIGVFVNDTGPASLFGPAQRAAAELGADQVNGAGGILGRNVEITFVDGGASPAEGAKTAVRLMLSDKVDMIFGSHDSAVRLAIEGAIKGKVPYVYTPVYEGSDCANGSYFLGETPQQQMERSIEKLAAIAGGKSFYLIGNDYVWPRTTNGQAKIYIEKIGGKVIAEEYYPLGAANNFESSIAKIKSAAPAIVLQTLVGGDNVSFNRAFSDFGLSDSFARLSCLLEENTLAGIGADASKNLYSCLAYFANLDSPANKAFLDAGKKRYGNEAPQQSTISKGLFDAFVFAKAVAEKAGSLDVAVFGLAADGISFETPSGTQKIKNRNAIKDMYLAKCDGGTFEVIDTFKAVSPGQTC